MNPTIAGKPVVIIDGPILNMKSGFGEKLLCDGPTFSTGTACVYKCAFCYVPSYQEMNKDVQKALQETGKCFQDLVIRRRNPVAKLKDALMCKGKPRYAGGPKKVVYASPLVDVAANIELANETLECCLTICELTNWDIRLLSKSNLLPYIAKRLPLEFKNRVIFGVSTGTFDDKLAAAFEEGTAKVSKRLESLYWLQDFGFRTYGMVCPSLPQTDYKAFAQEAAEKVRVAKCEHVWGEVLNVRGESMVRTCSALRSAGYDYPAGQLELVANDKVAWEQYARDTFTALTGAIPADKLRFLQYVNADNLEWWKAQKANGAILLGKIVYNDNHEP